MCAPLPPLARLARLFAGAAGLALAAANAGAAALPTQLWWSGADGVHRVLATGAPAAIVASAPGSGAAAATGGQRAVLQRMPLGSVWKLFAYTYLQSRGAQEPAYRCVAEHAAVDDEYCCDPGGEVGRDDALARSCGPYFAPRRLHVDAADWQRFWRDRHAPAWLSTPAAFEPGTEVDVVSLLAALDAVPAAARQAARAALLPLSLKLDKVVPTLGAGPRFKTWSWTVGGERAGGAAGWLADGTPFWFGAAGTSKTALQAHAGWIAQAFGAAGLGDVAPEPAALAAQPCIAVSLFARYPIATVVRADGRAAPPGTITGPHRVSFASGTVLRVDASPGLQLRGESAAAAATAATTGSSSPSTAASPRPLSLEARWPIEDYVARVVDREGDATDVQAARALAVAARTYVMQNGVSEEGCRRIADDSRTQRVSPNPPTRAARHAAAFTEGLVLDGPPVHYHGTQAADGQMSWRAAVASSRAGTPFEAILAAAYPSSRLAAFDAAAGCLPLPEARDWLLAAQRRWREPLRREAGYEALPETLQVCRLAFGAPHSDQRLLQIRVANWTAQDGRVALLHEYLHLAFRHHPHGRDEDFVERLARRLVDSQETIIPTPFGLSVSKPWCHATSPSTGSGRTEGENVSSRTPGAHRHLGCS